MVRTISSVKMSDFDDFKTRNQFIVHANNEVFSLSNFSVDSSYVSGFLELSYGGFYRENSYRYIEKEVEILNEVHIYLSQYPNYVQQSGLVNIPLNDIIEIRIIEKNERKTTTSSVLVTVLILGGVAACILLAAFSGSGSVSM